MRQNFQCTGQGKLRRGSGFEKLLSTGNYNNSDFHDQLLSLSHAGGRQPVTLLFEAISTLGVRSLIIGTQQTVAQLNAFSGNYRILGGGFGGTFSQDAMAPRFKAAQQGDYVLLTNNFDKVKYLRLEQAADPITGKFLYDVPDLDIIALTQAKVIWQWKSVVFLADVTMDQERVSYRLVWSDFDNPTGFDPAVLSSITGFKDLFTYETILAGMPIGNSFLIYTTHGIWEMIAVGGDQSFDFRRVYNGEKDEFKGCLAYPNTLINAHDTHFYIGREGLYQFGQYYPAPDRPEWLHRASYDLLSNIDPAACDAHVAGVFADEVLFSVATKSATGHCPDYSLRINKAFSVADVVDHGFTAISQFSPQIIETIRDFIIENEICTLSGMASAGYPYGPEGLPRVLPAPSVPYAPDSIYQTARLAVAGTHVEDYTQPNSSSHSICSLIGGERLSEICRMCKTDPLLIAVSSADWCIKSLGRVYYREICANPSAVGTTDANGYTAAVGQYVLNGVTSILRFAPAFAADAMIKLSKLELKFLPAQPPQIPPLSVSLRVGVSAEPADPNTGVGIVFYQHSSKPLAYATQRNQAQHLLANTQPSSRALWNFDRRGRFIYVEITITGVGGDALFSDLDTELAMLGRTRNY
jgi:hypothetical protein